MTARAFLNHAVRRAGVAAFLLLAAACAPRPPVALAPLPDRPWTVLPGDEVKVRVYREPELNGQWVVNGRGEVILPGLGRMLVAGLTVDSLTELIFRGYSKRIIDAVVDVGIVRILPVLGEVRSPGLYTAEPTMTVQQMVAKAGGVRSSTMKAPTVMLQKGRDGTRYPVPADLRLDRVSIDEGDALVVFDPDVLARYAPWIDTLNRFGGLLMIFVTFATFSRR